MVSHTFPGIAPLVVSTLQFDQALDKFNAGKGNRTGEFGVSPAVGGQFVRVRVRQDQPNNPKVIRVLRLLVSSTVATRLRVDKPVTPSLGAIGSGFGYDPVKAGQTASVEIVSRANNQVSGLANTAINLRVPANQVQEVRLGSVLPPNSSMD